MTDEQPTCDSCRFFELHVTNDPYGFELCRRFPPQFVVNSDDGPIFEWPHHRGTEWCGEHQRANP